MSDLTANLQEIASNAKAWPYAEARALASRLDKMGDAKDEVLFETGYGPSGLPHIGTFGEVVRTTMVRQAFESLTGRKTRLICFSDDMDGFRKIPDNVPNHEMLATYLHMPLTKSKIHLAQRRLLANIIICAYRRFLIPLGFNMNS